MSLFNKKRSSAAPVGEKTSRQAMLFQPTNANMITGLVGVVSGAWGMGGLNGTFDAHASDPIRSPNAGLWSAMHVNGIPVSWPGQYPYFRRVLADPSIQFVRALSYSPILASKWVWEFDANCPKEAREMLPRMINPLRSQYLDDAVRSFDYGWAPFEVVYMMHQGLLWPKRLKALLHELTSIYVDDGGNFLGFSNNGSDVPEGKSLLVNYDCEAGNLYGRGLVRNLLEVMPWWYDANDGAAQYDRKIAGVYLVCHYPPGKSIDADGHEVDNSDIAQKMLDSVAAGHPIALCNEFAGEQMAGADFLTDYSQVDRTRWKLEILQDNGSRQPGFTDRLTYLDKQKARAWHVPERAAFEAIRSGSRADSESMGDVVMTVAQNRGMRLAEFLNGGPTDRFSLVNTLLRVNWGEETIGTARVHPAAIEDDLKKFYRDLSKELVSGFPQLVGEGSSITTIFEKAGMPTPSTPTNDEKLMVVMEDSVAMKLPDPKGPLPPNVKNNQALLSRIYKTLEKQQSQWVLKNGQ